MSVKANTERHYTKSEAAKWLRCCTRTLERAVKAGELEAFLLGREVTFTEAELIRWRNSKRILPAAKVGRPRRQLQIVHVPGGSKP